VEDQQPAAGDLTVDDTPELEDAAEQPAQPEQPDGDAVAAPEDAEDAEDAEDGEDAEDVALQTRRPAGKRIAIAVAIAAVLFVGSAAFAGAVMQPYLSDRAVVATKLKVARTAANAITTLWTYTPENMDTLADRAAAYLSGDFAAQYRKFVDAIVAPNKQAKITNRTEVSGAAVESLEGANAVAIVYTNTTSTSPLTKNVPSLKYLSYRLIMKRDNGRWLVTRMTTITSLDLTPQL
jgi:Mce-associated membrane protein